MSVVNIPPRSMNFPPSNATSGGRQVGTGSVSGPYGDDPSQSQLHQTLSRMAQYIRKTRLHLPPFFADFDKLKSGALSWNQFARVLATVGFGGLTHALVENLAQHYSMNNDPTKVSYRAFIADVERIAAAQQQEQHEAVKRETMGPSLDEQAPLKPRSEEEKAAADGGLNQTLAWSSQPFTTQHDIHAHAPLTSSKLLRKIQTVCQQRRIIPDAMFADFDPLRKHVVTLQQFRRCLDIAGFQLSDSEADTLVMAYLNERDPNKVEYQRFIRDVQAPFIPQHAELDPKVTLPKFEPYKLEKEETPPAAFSPVETQRIEHLLKEMGYQVHTRRILVKPGFAHHDSTRSGCVTARQFTSVLTSTFPNVRLSTRDHELLCAYYRRGNLGVCYMTFLKDLEMHEKSAEEYAKTLHPSHAAALLEATHGAGPLNPLPKEGYTLVAGMKVPNQRPAAGGAGGQSMQNDVSNVDELLQRIKETMSKQRMHSLDDIFADFDHLKKYRITRAQFFRALTNAGLKLSPQEATTIMDAYPHQEFPEEVAYKQFLTDISNAPRF